jgi:hypothetical protein
VRRYPEQYAELHGELLQCCRDLAKECDERHRGFYDEVEQLVRPWHSANALGQADRAILVEVLKRCRHAERALGGWFRLVLVRRLLRMISIGLICGLGLAMIAWAAVRWWLPLQNTLKSARLQITLALGRLGVAERWMIGGTVIVLIFMLLLSRSGKS